MNAHSERSRTLQQRIATKAFVAKKSLVSFTFAKPDFPVAAVACWERRADTRDGEQPHATPTAFEIWEERLCYKHVIPCGIKSGGVNWC
jgi:hypothetical protein